MLEQRGGEIDALSEEGVWTLLVMTLRIMVSCFIARERWRCADGLGWWWGEIKYGVA